MSTTQAAQFAVTWPPEHGRKEDCPGCAGSGYDEREIRCIDCFGSGIKGDGQVSVLSSRELAALSDCPRCSAPALEACERDPGQPRRSFHQERHRSSVAKLLRGVIDRPDLLGRAGAVKPR